MFLRKILDTLCAVSRLVWAWVLYSSIFGSLSFDGVCKIRSARFICNYPSIPQRTAFSWREHDYVYAKKMLVDDTQVQVKCEAVLHPINISYELFNLPPEQKMRYASLFLPSYLYQNFHLTFRHDRELTLIQDCYFR